MTIAEAAKPHPGVVVNYPNRAREPQHEYQVHRELARRLAALQGMRFAGDYDPAARYARPPYFVPSGTIVGSQAARALGLTCERDLFGGVVPQPFVATKAISHGLIRPDADAPLGWSREFGAEVSGSVLAGYSVFSIRDAREAGRRLLREGSLRIKPVRATAGRGQQRIDEDRALDQALEQLDEQELARYGLVLEVNLLHVTTYSVGQIRVAGQQASYYGIQRLTRDNQGETVYGGSDLLIVEGGFETLLALGLPDSARRAIAQAQVYDAAASACYREFFASRRNYDIAQGVDGRGRLCSGVLEQSWRIGGASSAEIAALEAFREGRTAPALRASSIELYGEAQQPPAEATVLYRDVDAEVGFITKCVKVEDYGDPL